MRKLSLILLASGALFASNCDSVIEGIADKIRANGVEEFAIEAIPKGTETDWKVVGVCGGGTKDIVYKKGKVEGHPQPTAKPKPTEEEPDEKIVYLNNFLEQSKAEKK